MRKGDSPVDPTIDLDVLFPPMDEQVRDEHLRQVREQSAQYLAQIDAETMATICAELAAANISS